VQQSNKSPLIFAGCKMLVGGWMIQQSAGTLFFHPRLTID
jgi:hypothetical protein